MNKLRFIGVAIILSAIIILWGYSFKLRWDSIEWNKSTEAQLGKDAKKNWDEAFTTLNTSTKQ